MFHEFYSRVRRYFRNEEFEFWSIEFDYDGTGYAAEDKLILKWNHHQPKVLLLTASHERITSEEYNSIILGLFEDLTDGEGTFELKYIFDANIAEYDIEELEQIHMKAFTN